MPTIKHDRVQELIKEVASNVILFQLKDPRLGFITITRVDLSPDLRQAKIYYSVLGTDADAKLTAHAMRHARGHVQREVAKHLHIRFAPEISFEFDESPRKSIELAHIIDQAIAEDLARHKNDETTDATGESSESDEGPEESDELHGDVEPEEEEPEGQ